MNAMKTSWPKRPPISHGRQCRARTRLAAAGCAAAVCVTATACWPGKPDPPPSPTPTVSATQATAVPPAQSAPGCASSSALTIGVKVDQYGTGYLDVRTYTYEGFDVDVANYMASALFNDQTPYFLPVSSDTREAALASCAVRFFVATYTTLPGRQKEFDIAGPYLVTFQGVMLGPHSPSITGLSGLDHRRVCVAGKGSQSENVLRQNVPKAIPVAVDSYSTCLKQLRRGNVDAFSTDLAILYGYLSDPSNSDLRIVKGVTIGDPIFYGIAFRKSDHALCLRARDAIKAMISSQSQQWDSDLDKSTDLPDYVADQGLYPAGLKPSAQQIDDNSCVTPAGLSVVIPPSVQDKRSSIPNDGSAPPRDSGEAKLTSMCRPPSGPAVLSPCHLSGVAGCRVLAPC